MVYGQLLKKASVFKRTKTGEQAFERFIAQVR